MSAETIPADVIELVAKTIHDHWQGAPGLSARPWDGEKGTCAKLPAQAEDFRRKARAVMEALATRPAEPAAPVAKAGGGETYYTKGKDADWFECLSHQDAAWALTCAAMDLNDTGIGDQVDLFMPHNAMLSGAGDRIKNLCSALEAERARADRLEQERDWQYEENVARIAAQGAAEQRAADALARAEKAQVALLSVREAMLMARDVLADPSTIGIDDTIWMPEAVLMNETLHDYLERAAEFAARASREAQPATDGND